MKKKRYASIYIYSPVYCQRKLSTLRKPSLLIYLFILRCMNCPAIRFKIFLLLDYHDTRQLSILFFSYNSASLYCGNTAILPCSRILTKIRERQTATNVRTEICFRVLWSTLLCHWNSSSKPLSLSVNWGGGRK